MKKKVLVIHGPNLNMLGIREPQIYGDQCLQDINNKILKKAGELDVEAKIIQSNVEGDIINQIHSAYNNYDAIIINPGAFTHYSYAIRDAIEAVGIPTIEVHISNIYKREPFRANSVIAPVCLGQISAGGSIFSGQCRCYICSYR